MRDFYHNFFGVPYDILRVLIEKEARLIAVSGFDVEKLIELFAAGYTLEPPKHGKLENILGDMT